MHSNFSLNQQLVYEISSQIISKVLLIGASSTTLSIGALRRLYFDYGTITFITIKNGYPCQERKYIYFGEIAILIIVFL